MTHVPSIPNPGSPNAVARGCTCPVEDNADGDGVGADDVGRVWFMLRHDCPLHGTGDWLDQMSRGA